MTPITTNYEPLFEGIEAAFEAAVLDTRDEAERRAERHSRTGRFARSIEAGEVVATSEGFAARIGSPLVSARAKEKGAYVEAKRAPWLVIPQRDGSVRKVKAVRLPPRPAVSPAGARFPDFMTARLRQVFGP